MKNDRKMSKFLSLVLRHKPEEIGLFLDEQGWASTYDLLTRINAKSNSSNFDFDDLKRIVDTNDKQRFKFSSDYMFIKANQGHSIEELKLEFESAEPPIFLFHGTSEKNMDKIKEQGLLPMQRHHVHLTDNFQTALKTGKRHGTPVVLTISAQEMYENGIEFFISDNNVWLVDKVASNYIIT